MEMGEKLVLLDADVIVHLFKAEKLSILQGLYPKRIIILDVVFEELNKNPIVRDQIQNLILFKVATLYDFPTDNAEILREYSILKNSKGKGESACMAVCRYQKQILASSNLSDTKAYCEKHQIEYLTTLDLLAIAYSKKIITKAEADQAIYDITSKGSKLPARFKTIEEYIKKEFDKTKLNY